MIYLGILPRFELRRVLKANLANISGATNDSGKTYLFGGGLGPISTFTSFFCTLLSRMVTMISVLASFGDPPCSNLSIADL